VSEERFEKRSYPVTPLPENRSVRSCFANPFVQALPAMSVVVMNVCQKVWR
jgi:hypothetical protein